MNIKMARVPYARLRNGRSTATKGGKAIFWCLVLVVASTYTLITTTGIDYPKINILPWVRNEETPSYMQFAMSLRGNMSWQEVQDSRVNHIAKVCRALNLTQTLDHSVMRHLLVDTRHKAIMCFVPKVACTSWKRVWFWLVGLLEIDEDVMSLTRAQVHGKILPTLASLKFTEEQREEYLKTYKKFMFTRNPLDRLVSAYRDKLENEDTESAFDFHKHVGQEVERMIRGKVTGAGHNVTFPEFVRWLTPPNGTWTAAQMNEHWQPMVDLCAPCTIQYNAVGRYEEFKEEVNATLNWIGAGEYYGNFPQPEQAKVEGVYQTYIKQLSATDRLRLLKTYLLDFLLFGYNLA